MFAVDYTKKDRRKYHQSSDGKNVLDNKEFWKAVKLLLFDKNIFSKINIEKNLSDDFSLSEVFSTLFADADRSLTLKQDGYRRIDIEHMKDPLEIDAQKFWNPAKFLAIRQNMLEVKN